MRPNIVYLHSHDTGRYIQPYGFAVPTPRLQAFAESGVLFRRAFCAAPTCSPSRAALLTGTNPHTSGMLGLVHRGFRLHNPNHLFPHTLRASGYHTGLAGIQHVLPEGELASCGGWDVVRENGHNAVVENACRFLQTAPRNRPFFLDAGFFETHRKGRAFGGDPNDGDAVVGDGRYVLPPVVLPDTPNVRRDWADYCQSAARLDSGIGRVLDALHETGRENETIVLITTDHGVPFPGMKCSLTDRGTGVSLLLRGPNGIADGRVVDALVSHLDVFPTLCELAGIDAPAWLEGVSLGPLLRGETSAVRDAVFSEVTFHAAYEPKRSVRTDKWRYIRNYGPRQTPVLPNCDDGLSKDVWMAQGWRDRPVPREELYDLTFDPGEVCNRADDPACAAVRTDLAACLTQWMEQTRDPLLAAPNGVIPVPAGARINDASGTSPTEALIA